jgi:hypothetical protein
MHIQLPQTQNQIPVPADQMSQMTLKKFLQARINDLKITTKEQLKSPKTQAKIAEILKDSGYLPDQVHWHKINGDTDKRWAELCDGHHHKKPQPAPVSELHKPCTGNDCKPFELCTGPECKKKPFLER